MSMCLRAMWDKELQQMLQQTLFLCTVSYSFFPQIQALPCIPWSLTPFPVIIGPMHHHYISSSISLFLQRFWSLILLYNDCYSRWVKHYFFSLNNNIWHQQLGNCLTLLGSVIQSYGWHIKWSDHLKE